MVEHLTTAQEVEIRRQERPKVDLAELAKRRWIDGRKIRELAGLPECYAHRVSPI